jgi:hypothetical protein
MRDAPGNESSEYASALLELSFSILKKLAPHSQSDIDWQIAIDLRALCLPYSGGGNKYGELP